MFSRNAKKRVCTLTQRAQAKTLKSTSHELQRLWTLNSEDTHPASLLRLGLNQTGCHQSWLLAKELEFMLLLLQLIYPCGWNQTRVLQVYWAGKTFTAKLQDSISTSNHVQGLYNPTWTNTPWTPPPLGAAPNRLPPELAPHRTIEATKKSTELEFALLTLQLIHPFGETRPLQTNCQTGVLQVWCDEKTSTAKLQDSRLTSNHVRGLSPPVGAAPNRLLLELAPHRTIEATTIQKNFTSHTLQLIHPFSWTRPLQTKCQARVLQVWCDEKTFTANL